MWIQNLPADVTEQNLRFVHVLFPLLPRGSAHVGLSSVCCCARHMCSPFDGSCSVIVMKHVACARIDFTDSQAADVAAVWMRKALGQHQRVRMASGYASGATLETCSQECHCRSFVFNCSKPVSEVEQGMRARNNGSLLVCLPQSVPMPVPHPRLRLRLHPRVCPGLHCLHPPPTKPFGLCSWTL